MTEEKISFLYRKTENQQSERTVKDIKKFTSGNVLPKDYLRAYDIDARAYRSFSIERMHHIKGIDQPIEDWIKSIPTDHAYVTERQKEIESLKILFTGFPRKTVLPELEALAEAHGLWLRKQRKVSKDLDILVIGNTAGQKKIADAQKQECLILTKDQFLNFLETGEIPSE